MRAPAGFQALEVGRVRGFAVAEAMRWVQASLSSHGTLHAWAAACAEREELAGRRTVYSIPAPARGPDGRSRWVVRHYWRGGALASLLVDRYLRAGGPRPVAEAQASTQARARGAPTPAVLAGALYPAGMYYRADLVTELIPSARDLAAVVFGPPDARYGPDALEALAAAGDLVRRAAGLGIDHPDLNAKNIVLEGGGPTVRAHLVDLDRCRVLAPGEHGPEAAMLARLERSLRKLEASASRPLTPEAWSALRRGFGERA